MEDEKRARARARGEEAEESPRKTPRLEPAAARARARGEEAVESPRKTPRLEPAAARAPGEAEAGGEQCGHLYKSPEEIGEILAEIESSSRFAECEYYPCGVAGRSSTLVCAECSALYCAAAGEGRPRGHARWHAENEGHFVALWRSDPSVGYCFSCERSMRYYWEAGEDAGEIMVGGGDAIAGGHVLRLGDESVQWRHNASCYAIRGIPNLGNTCYLNALVQCLLVLGKMREWMLGPDAPTGDHGTALQYFFTKTNRANDAGDTLDPSQLLAYVCLGDSKFRGSGMQDSHELLVYLRNALGEEKLKKPPGMREGAPVDVSPAGIDSIFKGQLCVTRSCKSCLVKSVSYDVFYDLSVPLPSNGTPAESVASSAMSNGFRSHTNLSPPINGINMESIQAIAEDFELNSTEAEHIQQSRCVVNGPLLTQKDDDSGETIKVVDFFPHNDLLDLKVQGIDESTADSYSPWDTGLPPLVSPSKEKNERMTSGSSSKQDAHVGLNEASIEVKENTKPVELTIEDKGKAWSGDIVYEEGDNTSLASIEDCLALHFKPEVIEKLCENCPKVSERLITNESKDGDDGVQTEQSDWKTCDNGQPSNLTGLPLECTSSGRCSNRQLHGSDAQHELIKLTVDRTTEGVTSTISCCEDLASCSTANYNPECNEVVQETVPSFTPPDKINILSAEDSQNGSTLNQGREKQVKLGNFSHQHRVEEHQNELKDTSGYATETCLLCKLPPVLIVQLKRSVTGLIKVRGHVRFKEILDVGPFMDPSSEDKGNSSYRLVGVIEHLGGLSADVGHYVSYVRSSQPLLSSSSSPWFCVSDSNIREVSLVEVLKCEGYIFFYERMEG